MDLYLIRHGLAGEADPARWPNDADRPLTRKGKERIALQGHALRRLRVRPCWILSSPFRRAEQTARLLADRLAVPNRRLRIAEELEPMAEPRAVLPLLAELADAVAVALVGHQPQLGRLAARLLLGDAGDARLAAGIDLRKGSVLGLRLGWPTAGPPLQPAEPSASSPAASSAEPTALLRIMWTPGMLRRVLR